MARYQLFRTSSALSGQVRLDIILNKDSDQNSIGNEIHIVPINDNIDFNESNKRNTLRYSHLENIKNLYREIGSSFFSTDGEYSGASWLFQGSVKKDPYSHIYMEGPKRMRYSRYGKQFSYMMPLWISEATDFGKMLFAVHINSGETDNIIGSFRLGDDIIKYLNEYFDNSPNDSPISENLVNVDFSKMESWVQGVQASTGQYMIKDTSYILDFLLNRERPMMETDFNILDLFRQNDIISQQLINLNFVFNLEDVSGAWPEYLLYNTRMNFWVETIYDGVKLEWKDLFTNYDFIPKYNLTGSEEGYYMTNSPSVNVLDYMEDYNCEDMILKNKFIQPVFHWSLVNNPNYIFNIYSGCCPIIGGNNEYKSAYLYMEGGSFNWVDVSLNSVDPWRMNWKWLKYKDRMNSVNWNTQFHDANAAESWKTLYTHIQFNRNSIAIESNIFKTFLDDNDAERYSEILSDLISGDKKIWLALVQAPVEDDTTYGFEIPDWDSNNICCVIYCERKKDMLLYNLCNSDVFISEAESIPIPEPPTVDPVEFERIMNEREKNKKILLNFFKYMTGTIDEPNESSNQEPKTLYDRWIRPNKVEFNQGLQIYKPDNTYLGQHTQEFQYVSINQFPSAIRSISSNKKDVLKSKYYRYLYRYSGNLTPFFIDPESTIDPENITFSNSFWRYYQWDNDQSDIMRNCSILKNNQIPMTHPSIILGSVGDINVTYFPWIENGNIIGNDFYEDWCSDKIWGRNSLLWNLPSEIKFEFTSGSITTWNDMYTRIKEEFINKINIMTPECPLAEFLRDNSYSEEMWLFIIQNYELTYNFDYESEDNINNIIYTITFKLR